MAGRRNASRRSRPPSKPSAPATVSSESAITSRDTREYFIPSVPIEMPSETVMVPKATGLPPAELTPAEARAASTSRCMLHGVTWLQAEQTPICVLAKSSREKPTACSMARPGARDGPSSTTEENGRVDGGRRRLGIGEQTSRGGAIGH
jgi:hypothetical protein